MVTAALERAAGKAGGKATGGLSLGSMPAPEALGPFGAHLVAEELDWCSGHVLFACGSEVSVVDQPRLLEAVRTDEVASLAHVLAAFDPGALAPAEERQATTGASNPRFGPIFSDPGGDATPSSTATCAVIAEQSEIAAAVISSLEARGVSCTPIPVDRIRPGFRGSADALSSAAASAGGLDAVVVALGAEAPSPGSSSGWERTLAEHTRIVDGIQADAGWARAAADQAATADRPLRLVTLTDAATSGGRSRAQAAAQHARAARGATGDRVAAFAVSLEGSAAPPVGELVGHLACSPGAVALSGAELVAGPGWVGLRSHPRPGGSITFGGPEVPGWLDGTLRGILGEGPR